MLQTDPAVFAVGNQYQIMVPVTGESLIWVRIGDECFYDESNGIMCSRTPIHRVTVPMELLDCAGGYTVCERELIERKPYFPTSREPVEKEYAFFPIPDAPRAYLIADAHGRVEQPVAAARAFGEIDFLIMDGDVVDHSGDPEQFLTVYRIAQELTHGSRPVVFARGNHDLRGYYAESFAEYTPCENGRVYYTFRLGPLWGVILDCGEDKDDSHPEYGYTVSCHGFRQRQTGFLRDVIARADREYNAPGVTRRLVIAHNPFVHCLSVPFDIERDIYAEWVRLLRENVKPDLLISGHLHVQEYHPAGDGWDDNGTLCPAVVCSVPMPEEYRSAGFVFGNDRTAVTFTSSTGETVGQFTIPR